MLEKQQILLFFTPTPPSEASFFLIDLTPEPPPDNPSVHCFSESARIRLWTFDIPLA
jgi:hypothetical protein